MCLGYLLELDTDATPPTGPTPVQASRNMTDQLPRSRRWPSSMPPSAPHAYRRWPSSTTKWKDEALVVESRDRLAVQ